MQAIASGRSIIYEFSDEERTLLLEFELWDKLIDNLRPHELIRIKEEDNE